MSTADPSIATVDPDADDDVCDDPDCSHTDGLVTVDPDAAAADRRTVCSTHFVEYLEELRQ